jgi:hypothetical protein
MDPQALIDALRRMTPDQRDEFRRMVLDLAPVRPADAPATIRTNQPPPIHIHRAGRS